MIKSRRTKRTACSTRGEMKMHIRFGSKNLDGRDHLGDLGTDEKRISECLLS
jgi:hypothetical protein